MRRLTTLTSSFLLAFVTLMGISALMGGSLPGMCPLSANAQDNPCLAQDATISALNVQLLTSQLDSVNAQATITALNDQLTAMLDAPPVVNAQGTPLPPVLQVGYTETFDNNDRGWEMGSSENGAVRISQGKLLFSGGERRGRVWSAVPNLPADGFRIDVEVTPAQSTGHVFFLVSSVEDNEIQEWRSLAFGFRSPGFGREWGLFIDGSEYNSTFTPLGDAIWEPNQKFEFSIEITGTNAAIFLRDELIEYVTLDINRVDNVAIGLNSSSSNDYAGYDNVTVSLIKR